MGIVAQGVVHFGPIMEKRYDGWVSAFDLTQPNSERSALGTISTSLLRPPSCPSAQGLDTLKVAIRRVQR